VTAKQGSWLTCFVNTLIKATPFTNQSFFQMVDIADLAMVHSLFQNAPDLIVNRRAIQAIWWPVLHPDEVQHLG